MASERDLEHRNTPRRKSLLAGIILHGEAGLTTDCTIRDLTDSGAKARIPSAVFMSAPIVLIIPTHDAAFSVRVMWEQYGEVGLQFGDPLNLQSPATTLEKMAHRLWLERRAR